MKILHVLLGFDINYPGGITNYVRSLASSQMVNDEVVVLCESDRDNKSTFQVITYSSDVIKPFMVSMKRDPVGDNNLTEIFKSGFDLIHFHLTINFSLDLYRKIPRIGVPYVISIHDYFLVCPRITMMNYKNDNCGGPSESKCSICIGRLDQVDLLYKGARRLKIILPRVRSGKIKLRIRSIKEFVEGAEFVLPVSTKVEKIMKKMYPLINSRVLHIGNESANASRPLKNPSERTRLVFIGVLSKHKGATVLEKIMDGVNRSDVEFHFHGRCMEGFDERLSAKGLILHGAYSPDDMRDIMSNSDIGLVLPIWEDNGPQVLMEFINYGVPVIATSMGGIPDFVTESRGILFNPYDEIEIDKICTLINDHDSLNDLKKLKSDARLKTPEEHAQDLRGLYTQAVESFIKKVNVYDY